MILTIVSKKGGVGKTTTAVNLSAALATHGCRVLLVDLDAQGSASLSCGIPRRDFAPSCAEALRGQQSIVDVIRPSGVPNLDIITSSVDLAGLGPELEVRRRPEAALADLLRPVAEVYHYVLIDCPPCMSLLARCGIVASDALLVPTVPQFLAQEGVENVLEAAHRCAQRNQHRVKLAGILLNLVDPRTRLSRRHSEALRKRFGEDVLSTEIRQQVTIAAAPDEGRPVLQSDPDSDAAARYWKLASEIMERTHCRELSALEPFGLSVTVEDDEPSGAPWPAPQPPVGN